MKIKYFANFLLLLTLVSCGKETPETSVDTYLNAVSKWDIKTAKEYECFQKEELEESPKDVKKWKIIDTKTENFGMTNVVDPLYITVRIEGKETNDWKFYVFNTEEIYQNSIKLSKQLNTKMTERDEISQKSICFTKIKKL